MVDAFQVLVPPRFRRQATKLLRQHPELVEVLDQVQRVLRIDPTNHSGTHDIAKLTDVPQGEGQWRIRVGQYRLRYDITGQEVVLYSFRHRREVY